MAEPVPPDRSNRETIGTAEHCLCGLAGALATAGIVAFLYPALVTLTSPLDLLSSTTLVVLLVTTWFMTWFGFELLWEWRAGRLDRAAPE